MIESKEMKENKIQKQTISLKQEINPNQEKLHVKREE